MCSVTKLQLSGAPPSSSSTPAAQRPVPVISHGTLKPGCRPAPQQLTAQERAEVWSSRQALPVVAPHNVPVPSSSETVRPRTLPRQCQHQQHPEAHRRDPVPTPLWQCSGGGAATMSTAGPTCWRGSHAQMCVPQQPTCIHRGPPTPSQQHPGEVSSPVPQTGYVAQVPLSWPGIPLGVSATQDWPPGGHR